MHPPRPWGGGHGKEKTYHRQVHAHLLLGTLTASPTNYYLGRYLPILRGRAGWGRQAPSSNFSRPCNNLARSSQSSDAAPTARTVVRPGVLAVAVAVARRRPLTLQKLVGSSTLVGSWLVPETVPVRGWHGPWHLRQWWVCGWTAVGISHPWIRHQDGTDTASCTGWLSCPCCTQPPSTLLGRYGWGEDRCIMLGT